MMQGEDDLHDAPDISRAESTAGPAVRRVKLRRIAAFAAGSVAAIIAVLWVQRIAISDTLIQRELEGRGISASYRIEAIGLRTQRLTDLVIGDVNQPDLTAKTVELTLNWGWSGPSIQDVMADGVRLRGRFENGALSFGELDKFSDPESTEPFAIPDFHVTLSDAQLAMVTPWGALGGAAAGEGSLRRSFDGKLAIVAPRLAQDGCVIVDSNFIGDLKIRGAEPRFIGPLSAASLRCADQNADVQSLLANVDAKVSEDFARWSGRAEVQTGSLRYAENKAETMALNVEFSGEKRFTNIGLAGSASRLSTAQGQIAALGLKLQGDIGSGKHMFEGTVTVDGARAAASLRQQAEFDGQALAGTPLAPLVDQMGRSVGSLMSDVSGTGRVAFSGDSAGQRFALRDFNLRSASGARMASNGESEIAAVSGPEGWDWFADGRWSVDGGGLPNTDVAVQWQSNGRFVGRLEMEPYTAGTATLALAPLTVSGDARQGLRFQTTVRLSGPLADGHVEQLVVPLQGQASTRGGVSIDGGCREIAAQSIAVSGYRLDRPRFDLCSAAGQDLLRYRSDGLTGEVVLPKLELNGQSGSNALTIAAGQSRYNLGNGIWSVQGADVRMVAQTPSSPAQGATPAEGATPAAPTQFSVAAVTGGASGSGMAGTVAGGSGRIGVVPLNFREIDGSWQWQNGVLTIVSQVELTDADADPRFRPLVARGATLRFADGKINALAAFHEPTSGHHVIKADLVHNLGSGSGEVKLAVPELRFDEDFQPDQLSRLALGVVAEVDAAIVGDGYVRWNDSGVTSGGTFATANANLAAAFGPVVGLSGTIMFDDLLDLRTLDGQIVTIKEINPGIPIYEGQVEYALIGGNKVRIEGGTWPLAGGELTLHPTTLNFAEEETRHLSFEMIGIDAANFLQRFSFENLNVTGTFDGSLPVEFDGMGGRVVDGRIDSRSGGGSIEYVGELSNRNLGMMANFAFGALRSLTYDDLSIVLNGALDGEMVTDIRFGGVGQGEGATQNFVTRQISRIPMIFNVKLSAPFRSLFTTVSGLYDPSVQIEEKLPELYRQQMEYEASQSGQNNVVQPPASEPVQ